MAALVELLLSIRVELIEMRCKNKTDKVTSPESVSLHPEYIYTSMSVQNLEQFAKSQVLIFSFL